MKHVFKVVEQIYFRWFVCLLIYRYDIMIYIYIYNIYIYNTYIYIYTMILYIRICFNIPDVFYLDKFVEIQLEIRVGTRFQAVEALFQELFSIHTDKLGNCLELTIRAGNQISNRKFNSGTWNVNWKHVQIPPKISQNCFPKFHWFWRKCMNMWSFGCSNIEILSNDLHLSVDTCDKHCLWSACRRV